MDPRPLIAVVDDEEMVRRALSRVLATANFDAAAFASGEEFFEWLKSHTPACVVLDFKMPGLDGREVQRRLIKVQPHLPVIILSAHDYPSIHNQFMDDGAAAYLHKPLERQSLLDALHAILHRKPS